MNQREAELVAQGWTRRFVGAPPRLQEAVQLYQSLGYEVLLEPQSPEELDDECKSCALALGLYRVIFTRQPRQTITGTDADGRRRSRVRARQRKERR